MTQSHGGSRSGARPGSDGYKRRKIPPPPPKEEAPVWLPGWNNNNAVIWRVGVLLAEADVSSNERTDIDRQTYWERNEFGLNGSAEIDPNRPPQVLLCESQGPERSEGGAVINTRLPSIPVTPSQVRRGWWAMLATSTANLLIPGCTRITTPTQIRGMLRSNYAWFLFPLADILSAEEAKADSEVVTRTELRAPGLFTRPWDVTFKITSADDPRRTRVLFSARIGEKPSRKRKASTQSGRFGSH